MNKKTLEITLALGSVVIFIILIAASKILLKTSAGFGYTVSLLFFIIIMGLAGLKLAQIPDK
ncbi:Uncharacterised protein [uncultured archaeon]|nr:Uncharacterised protein [uncultured archaeon]